MAFLKLKKAFHMDEPLKIQILVDSLEEIAERNDYDNMEYKYMVKNIGEAYPTKEPDSYKLNKNQEFDFVASEALYKHMSLYDKDDFIQITMKSNKESKAGFVWDVQPTKPSNGKPVSNADTSLEIKWGMAFNNATRLVADNNLKVKQKVELIEKIMPEMFKIACSMPSPIKEDSKVVTADNIQEVIDESLNKQAKKEDEDDLPF